MRGVRAAEQRYGFQFPESYRVMLANGHFVAKSNAAIHLTDLEWLTPAAIAAYRPFDPPEYTLIPFATSGRMDEWCWRPDLADAGVSELPIVLRERGGP